MGDGTKQNPFTREDVLKAIEENGGTAKGLDLSEQTFVEAIDLSGLDLSGIKLDNARLFHANFNGSNLDHAFMQGIRLGYATFNPSASKHTSLQFVSFQGAHLENAEFREADLTGAQFGEKPDQLLPAYLKNTNFGNANLFLANFKDCYFHGTKFEGAFIRDADIYDAYLEEVDWGSYKIGEESKKEELHFAESIYRRLKIWYTGAGIADTAAKFYYREKEASRKGARRWNDRTAGWLSWAFFGHGERWERILLWIAAVIFGLAGAYHLWGSFDTSSYLDTLYYSATSFSALGYGNWAPQPTGWAKGMGAAEAVIGVFMMALLLVTFVRKWTR